MNTMYWDLFWTTGMPEAWLMSRNGERARQTGPDPRQRDGWGLYGPLAGFQPHMSENSPGGPEELY